MTLTRIINELEKRKDYLAKKYEAKKLESYTADTEKQALRAKKVADEISIELETIYAMLCKIKEDAK